MMTTTGCFIIIQRMRTLMTGTGSILEIRWFPWNTSVKERGSRQLLNDPSCDYYDQLYDQSFENED